MTKFSVRVDAAQKIRPIGKLSGTNNGPIHTFTDRTKEYREMGVDFVRFHETHSFNTKCVEVPFIFRDFSADENDPANYYFAETDAVIRGAVDAGIEIMYRLGMGTEGSLPRIFCVAPLDFEKWARVAEHIIMHYNEGWANGFHYNIEYWEVWNEPDLFTYWYNPAWKDDEVRPKFVEFYCTVSQYLKKKFPRLKFGAAGFATCRPGAPKADATPEQKWNWQDRMKMYDLLGEATESGKAAADFFCFHSYHRDIRAIRFKLERVQSLLSDFHLENMELINTEWGAIGLQRDKNGIWYYDQMYTAHSAVDTLATMLVYQKAGVTKAAYYDADERSKFCGLYEFGGGYKNHAYAFLAFKALKEAGTEVVCEGFEGPETSAVAAVGDGKLVVVFANDGEEKKATLHLENLPECDYAAEKLDTKLSPAGKGRFTGRALSVDLPRDTAKIITFHLK